MTQLRSPVKSPVPKASIPYNHMPATCGGSSSGHQKTRSTASIVQAMAIVIFKFVASVNGIMASSSKVVRPKSTGRHLMRPLPLERK